VSERAWEPVLKRREASGNLLAPVWAALLLLCLPAIATSASSSGGYSPLSFLLDLRGDAVKVRYTPGALDRASHAQDRFELVVADCKGWARSRLPLVVYVLGPEEWQAAEVVRPYGLPESMSSTELAVASWGDPQTVELWRSLLGRRLPVIQGTALRGSPEEVASIALHNLIAVVEAFEMCLAGSGISGDQPWIEGFLVQVMTRSFIQKHEAGRVAEVDGVFASFSDQGGGPGAHPVSQALEPDSLTNWLWAEAQFYEAAKLLDEMEGKAPAKAVFKLAGKQGGELKAADLVARFPYLADWLQQAFAGDPNQPEGQE
jgi:hypothetical protein